MKIFPVVVMTTLVLGGCSVGVDGESGAVGSDEAKLSTPTATDEGAAGGGGAVPGGGGGTAPDGDSGPRPETGDGNPTRPGVIPSACYENNGTCKVQKATPGYDMGCFGACGPGCSTCKKGSRTETVQPNGCKTIRQEWDCPVSDCCSGHDECGAKSYCTWMPNNPTAYDAEQAFCNAKYWYCLPGAIGWTLGGRRTFVEESSSCVKACEATAVAE